MGRRPVRAKRGDADHRTWNCFTRLEPIHRPGRFSRFVAPCRRTGRMPKGWRIGPDGTGLGVSFERWAHVVARFDQRSLHQSPSGSRITETFYDHADNWQLGSRVAIVARPARFLSFSEKPLARRAFRSTGWVQNGISGPLTGYLPERKRSSQSSVPILPKTASLYHARTQTGRWPLVAEAASAACGWMASLEDTVLWTGERGEHGNLEGISVWSGRNRPAFDTCVRQQRQATRHGRLEFVEFRVTED